MILSPSPLLVEHLVDEGDRSRSLPDRRGHSLDAAHPDVADREYAGQEKCLSTVLRSSPKALLKALSKSSPDPSSFAAR